MIVETEVASMLDASIAVILTLNFSSLLALLCVKYQVYALLPFFHSFQ